MNRFFAGQEIQKGYGLGQRVQQTGGFGLGGLFKNFLSFLTPFFNKAKENAIPILKSAARELGKEVVKSTSEIAKDVLEGKKLGESAKERITNSIENLTEKANEKMKGNGYKKRHKYKKKQSVNKKRKLDIFD
jgi:hypothetical protein